MIGPRERLVLVDQLRIRRQKDRDDRDDLVRSLRAQVQTLKERVRILKSKLFIARRAAKRARRVERERAKRKKPKKKGPKYRVVIPGRRYG